MHTTNQVCIYYQILACYTATIRTFFWGKDQFDDGLSLAYGFVVALISANLYSPKTKGQKNTLNKQENLMNSNKQSSPTIKNISKPTTISDKVELINNHGEFVIMKEKGYK